MVAAFARKILMTKTMKKLIRSTKASTNEWTKNAKNVEKNGFKKNSKDSDRKDQKFNNSSPI